MRIRDLFTGDRPIFSFEFFPPKTDAGEAKLIETVQRLQELGPSFVSVTKTGAKPAEKTVELTARLKREVGVEAMAHITCATAGRAEMHRILESIRDAGIENVLPLRGDPPADRPGFVRPPDGFGYASELVRFIKGSGFDFCMAGAAYPEKHPEAPSAEIDLRNLQTKVAAGVDFLITQLFYRNSDYFSFTARARALGIGVPIVPGIMPITNAAQIERIAELSGASIPSDLQADLDRTRGDEAAARAAGIAYAIRQCRELLERGAPGIHFYTLNQSPATSAILRELRRDYP
ncbi:MAG: methylenetetrahydrofolate reductase [NAD(P)H] [Polyangiaceae bacterium UTPRO1]|jgi:methylenetetrahydrofolate reductase (NADPH)|nr:methylenetetrahydrofolate reductase [NAD(P)H] [Myxococcales bacterium]OQY66989.1 MAG: methylenetetrahydrofolate reductase [NAD(P)H] [Polyangiaceae bacterium UTPRO1]